MRYPWPCASRRRQLLAEYTDSPVSLSLTLGSALVQATADLPTVVAGELHDRFLGWLPPLPWGQITSILDI